MRILGFEPRATGYDNLCAVLQKCFDVLGRKHNNSKAFVSFSVKVGLHRSHLHLQHRQNELTLCRAGKMVQRNPEFCCGCRLLESHVFFLYVFFNTHSLRLHLSLPIGWRGWDNNYFFNSTWRRLITAIIVSCSIFFLPPYLVSLRERKNHLEVAGIEKGPPA